MRKVNIKFPHMMNYSVMHKKLYLVLLIFNNALKIKNPTAVGGKGREI